DLNIERDVARVEVIILGIIHRIGFELDCEGRAAGSEYGPIEFGRELERSAAGAAGKIRGGPGLRAVGGGSAATAIIERCIRILIRVEVVVEIIAGYFRRKRRRRVERVGAVLR